jgi:hypothetical protein
MLVRLRFRVRRMRAIGRVVARCAYGRVDRNNEGFSFPRWGTLAAARERDLSSSLRSFAGAAAFAHSHAGAEVSLE